MKVVITLSPRDYDAVLFDLDGVLTRSASMHASVWKKLFDGFFEERAAQAGEPFVPFDIREALCTLGNGYFATRGAAAGTVADDIQRYHPCVFIERQATDVAIVEKDLADGRERHSNSADL